MILYRAMSPEEAEKTINNKEVQFIRRFKWFSPSLEFVNNRVRDGKFNNSKFSTEKYTHLLKFEFRDKDDVAFIKNKDEWMLDVRKTPLIKLLSVSVLKVSQ
jgi:hypothetical protein